MIVHKHKRVDSAPFNYGRQNAQHIAATSIHSYSKYIQNSGKLQWGYGFFLFRGPCFNTGSPLLARGIQAYEEAQKPYGGITPAYAGNTMRRSTARRPRRDHPRLRGEYSSCRSFAILSLGSPPLARGILPFSYADDMPPGITPACAGNTRIVKFSVLMLRDHPRLRGEY